MKKGKRGFTLIEVALFLVITGALFISVTIGVQNSIYQQRVNDSVQGFTEFLRGVYAQVLNVQNTESEGGRSEQAIYGKLITFGEKRNLAGEPVNPENLSDPGNEIFAYTVVGKVLQPTDDTSGNILEILKRLDAGVAVKTTDESGKEEVRLAGLVESYTPRWAAQIEPPCGIHNCDDSYQQLEGMVLIVRHPSSGTVYTYYTNELAQINTEIREATLDSQTSGRVGDINYVDFTGMDFGIKQVDFCINPERGVRLRHDVRIEKGARNASAVEIVPDDDSECRRDG